MPFVVHVVLDQPVHPSAACEKMYEIQDADGQFVAFHDADAGRVCGRYWKISETTWQHLKSLRVKGEEPIAHLDDILNLMILRPGRDFYFELALENEAEAAERSRFRPRWRARSPRSRRLA